MLKEKLAAGKDFVMEHKKEIAIGLATVVGGVIVYRITKKTPKINSFVKPTVAEINMGEVIEKLDAPKLDLGTIDDIWRDNWGTSIVLNDITISDMGKIGEELLKVEGVTNETTVTAVMGLLDKVEEVVEF